LAVLRRGFKTWCENAARGYRRDFGLSPIAPLDPFRLAAHLGITVWTPADIPGFDEKDVQHLTNGGKEGWSAATLRVQGQSLVIMNSGHARTRQNNSLAHELGHIVLQHEPAQMFVTSDGHMMMSEYNTAHEDEATWFAGAILLPRDALLDVAKRRMSHQAAAMHFGVSVELFSMRRNLTGVNIQVARGRGTWAP
jgi:hypothetical protein